MNAVILTKLVRALIQLGAGTLLAKGVASDDVLEALSGLAVAALTYGWSLLDPWLHAKFAVKPSSSDAK